MALAGKGKSGGARVIYCLVKGERIYLVMAYPKSRKDTLTNSEKNPLKQLAKVFNGGA